MAEEQPPEVKAEARQFMSDLMAAPPPEEFTGGAGADMAAWRDTFAANDNPMEKFWSIYNPSSMSIWTMVYDEADSNENLNDTVQLVKDFMKNTESLRDHCFGVMHILENLDIDGLWFFNGPDPEQLFGANEDTSWYTWAQLGPDANELVEKVVASILVPVDGKLNGNTIKDTQIF
mmetsp:Transcript_5166/g.6008  ORF Transcript_5166/g.6008 Transcript_5166/m.6008 type:complete len:176 (+) Transcript_5166:86-613(+)|eukprot:CAMPEP_0194150240 /NCGR_PEP_ID=MMETSP0152-20130528/42241_1 /TAXON_ID=1049557 /ORGANISM="Thalassiothrix antarctica, Strain L6-D1" /LENGTH=175 /DNA_ID=CAMNT_0038853035 /DNA_START=43 /DNA_END=573 /DNA_ORIENTATION=-